MIAPVPLACAVEAAATRAPGAVPLVILHGLFGSKGNWKSLQKALARTLGAPVVACDLRNHGESPHAPYVPGQAYAEMAADVDALLARLGLDEVDVVGHSMVPRLARLARLTRIRAPTGRAARQPR
eukprot:Unigene13365_Nuclearia_a/m.40510 Unigene13365_Nuclearia_a/g.40510  ORF Unigene13365_Nuclearia_a/g.40510 Unigene13365_Nuclearia_a/m.40510 type:complete len:126 (+) Unigene13365_Nuclearia_a:32-409(+)